MIVDHFLHTSKKRNTPKSNKQSFSENTARSVVKSISWRIVGTLDTVLISWLITGKVALALTIGSIELITKMVLYFLHERMWNHIKWGKK